MRKLVSPFVALSMLVVVACSSKKLAYTAAEVKGEGLWYVVSLQGENIASENKMPTLEFDFKKNVISGKTPCNRYDFPFVIEEKKKMIKFEEGFITRVLCEDFPIEKKFLQALPMVVSYVKTDSTITFLSSNKHEVMILLLKKIDWKQKRNDFCPNY